MTGAVIVALTAAVAVAVGPPLHGRELDRVPTRKREVALTLDAGDNARGAWRVVTVLVRQHVPATFFLTGRWARENRQLARVIGARFDVGNHTYSHPYLTRLDSSAVANEIRRGAQAIRRFARRDPRPLFRFPYGDSDSRTIAIANGLGYVPIRWTVDTLGWMGAEGQTVAGAVGRVLAALRPGAIILMHVGAAGDGSTIDTRALAKVISAVRRRGYSFTSLGRRLR
ncbi:MAG: polysaccharide deacetylase family protein [Actinomycetota bacterium]|nr:polysaccharide deacetylase family protein [Actinomycetota bacterium]